MVPNQERDTVQTDLQKSLYIFQAQMVLLVNEENVFKNQLPCNLFPFIQKHFSQEKCKYYLAFFKF
jgi:hypothetical protein